MLKAAFRMMAVCALAGALGAAESPPIPLNPAQQASYDRLCDTLIAPCCWRESIADHRSPASLEMRREVAAMLAGGQSERAILDAMIARHGQRILRVPEGARRLWLFWIPVVALLAGGFWLIRFLRRSVRPAPLPAAGPVAQVDDDEWI